MSYNKHIHGHIMYLSWISLDKDIESYPKHTIGQVLLDTKINDTVLVYFYETKQSIRINLNDITPRMKAF